MPTSAPEPLLAISGLSAGYGKIGVLRNIDLTIAPGESVALLGPNGAGKTTLLRAVSGLLPWSGQIRFGGKDMTGSNARHRPRRPGARDRGPPRLHPTDRAG
jgi:branched-chain amino acid transport system ATP-binding protein